MIVEIVLTILFLCCLLGLFLRRNYGKLEKLGVPVVPPSLFTGSDPLAIHKTNYVNLDMENFRKYGKIWGTYSMAEPWLNVADPELIKAIAVKNFENFPGHTFDIPDQKYRTLDVTKGEEWKDLRKGLSPTFSSGKIKGMLDVLGDAVDNMVNHLEEVTKTNNSVQVKELFQGMALDVIAKCAFGIESDSFKNPDNEIFKNGKEAFQAFIVQDAMFSTIMNIMMTHPILMKVIDIIPPGMKKLWTITKRIQDQRYNSGLSNNGDFVDRLIELDRRMKAGEFPNLSSDQITGQGVIFLAAGFETTSSTLSTLCYNLSKYPDVLETLVAEVDEIVERCDGAVGHETIGEMPYLEACIKENLRLNGPVARIDRICDKDWTHPENGMTIKKGTCIRFPYYVIHHNPEFWPEPELFKPERFLKENAHNLVPYSWIPFGAGPRACIGERFAMVEMKIAMVKLLQRFTPALAEDSKINVLNGDLFLYSFSDFNLKFNKRS